MEYFPAIEKCFVCPTGVRILELGGLNEKIFDAGCKKGFVKFAIFAMVWGCMTLQSIIMLLLLR